ncbi:MAG: sulfatase-like hydrolase/transferase [Caldilineaceae bacterium]
MAPYRHPNQPHPDIPVDEQSYLVRGNSALPADHHERVAQYYAGVTMIDHQVGTLLDYLEGHGILDNTLVIYTADHGHMIGHHGLYGKAQRDGATEFLRRVDPDSTVVALAGRRFGQCGAGRAGGPCDLFATMLRCRRG